MPRPKLIFLAVALTALACSAFLRADDDSNFPALHDIRLSGNSEISTKEILNFLPAKAGQPFDPKNVGLVREMVQSLYHNRGYLQATCQTEYRREPSGPVLVLSIVEGPRSVFNNVTIHGLNSLPRRVIDLEQSFKKGDPFSRQEIFNTQSRLYGTGLFDSVKIKTSTATETLADVDITVKEQPLRWIKGGVGWGSEEKERLSLTLTHENLFHRAYRVDLTALLSRIWTEYRADFTNRYFMNTRTAQQTSVSWRNERREGYEYERTLADASLARDIGHKVKGTVGYKIQKNTVFNLDPVIAQNTPNRSDLHAVYTAFNHDTANDFFYPSRGSRSNLLLQRAGGVFGGSIDYNKAQLDYKTYHMIKKPFIGAFSFRSGVIKPYGGSAEVPIFERFFTGGANSIRGYAERTVGPRDVQNSPLGGNYLLGSTLEVRYPLFWKFLGAVFIDGGNVGPYASDVAFNHWRYGVGTGIRLQTPVGPIRVDYGWKLNPEEGDKDRWRVHLSLGEAF